MYINETDLNWNGSLSGDNNPGLIVVHNADARRCSIQDIHQWHLNNGWTGCGYQYLIRKDGSVYRGRPEWAQGAHCKGYNAKSIGICLEGKFMEEDPALEQLNSLGELISDIRSRYGNIPVYGHKELNNTDCPGTHFPLDQVKSGNYGGGSSTPPEASTSDTTNLEGRTGKVVGITSCLNVRETPNGDVIGKLSNGDTVKFGFKRDRWYNIYFGDHGGWVSADYIQIMGQGDSSNPGKEFSKRLQAELNKQGFRDENGNELDVDGIPGRHTLEAASRCVIHIHAKGEITRWLQERLVQLGYSCGSYGADGTYGDATYNAIISFQRDNGLAQDGIVGCNTWRKLLGL